MAKIPAGWREQLEAHPHIPISAILRVNGEPATLAVKVQEAGLKIRYSYSFLPGFAVEGPGSGLLCIEDEPWLEEISSDRGVHTLQEG